MSGRSRAATPAEQLLVLLQRQREVLLRVDPDAIADLEAGTREIEQALAAAENRSSGSLPGMDAAQVARLQSELRINQATLANLAAGNRRALNALFGEPPLYSR